MKNTSDPGKVGDLRVVHVEDDPCDVELVAGWLENGGLRCQITQAQTETEFHAALDSTVDLIISDYKLPAFDGLSALNIAHERRPDVPFIVFSGTIGEELAIRSLKEGAVDYVLKERPQRLVSAIQHALKEANERAKRKEDNAKLREQAALLDKAQDAILVTDIHGRIRYWNKGAERLHGWAAEEVMGRSTGEFLYDDPSFLTDAWKTLAAKNEWSGEIKRKIKSGGEVLVHTHWSLVRDSKGVPTSILSISTDITERKRLEAQTLRAQRMETLGALAGGIAHDLNNVLAPILIGIELLSQELSRDEKANMLATMKGCAKRGSEMVKQIVSFARGVGGGSIPLQVKPLMTEIARLARETFPRSIEIESKIAPDLPSITGNATQLHQVLLNLCVNARDAMPNGGRLQLEASQCLLENYHVPGQQKEVSGGYIVLSVSDTGHGMTPEVLAKIFEPFFSTKAADKGTGLGLSTVIGIAKSHNGFVEVLSEASKGTIAKVYLPAGSAAADAATSNA